MVYLLFFYCTHYTLRGGTSDNGFNCGAFYVYASSSFSGASWAIGAALNCFILFYAWWWITI